MSMFVVQQAKRLSSLIAACFTRVRNVILLGLITSLFRALALQHDSVRVRILNSKQFLFSGCPLHQTTKRAFAVPSL